MNSLNWWQNLLGETLLALITCGVMLGLSLLKEQPVVPMYLTKGMGRQLLLHRSIRKALALDYGYLLK